MKKSVWICVSFLVGLAATAAAERYVVVFEGAVPADAGAIVAAAGGELASSFEAAGVVTAVSTSATFGDDLEALPGVEDCGRVEPRLLSEIFEEFEGPAFPAQWNVQRVRAEQAWPVTTGSHDTVVAVIDTGIALNHPELAPNIVDATCFAAFGICQDYPVAGHGTSMAGLIAGVGGVITGVGPTLGLASLNVIEFVDLDGDGVPETPVHFTEAAWQALFHAAEQGYEVASMSFGGFLDESDPDDKALVKAWRRVVKEVRKQGVTLVASAGNDGLLVEKPLVFVPAGLDEVVAVGATAVRPLPIWPQPGGFDIRAFYGNVGDFLTLSAPGGDCGIDDGFDPCFFEYLLVSTDVDLSNPPGCVFTGDCAPTYGLTGGTSGAGAMVAAAAGLVIDAWALPETLKPGKVEKVLVETAEPIGPAIDFGAGMVNVEAAVKRAAGLE